MRQAKSFEKTDVGLPYDLKVWLTQRARALGWSRAALIRHLLTHERKRIALAGVAAPQVREPVAVVGSD